MVTNVAIYVGTLWHNTCIPCRLIVIVASFIPSIKCNTLPNQLCTLVYLACVVCQRHTLQIHCSSSFIPSLCITVECSYSDCVRLTQVCSVVWAGDSCPAAACAAQIIGSNVESKTIDCLTAARSFTPLHSEAFTSSKSDTCDGRGWGRGWRERNPWHL